MSEWISGALPWYLGCAAVYAGLSVYVQARGGRGLLRGYLLGLAGAGAAWGISLAVLGSESGHRLNALIFGIEAVFMLTWFAFLYRLLRGPYKQSMPETVRRALYLFWALVALSAALVSWFVYFGDGNERAASYFHVIGLAVALTGFALAAQLNRDAPVEDAIALRALAAAGGLVMGAQVLVFGVATLAGAVSPSMIQARVLAVSGAAVLVFYAVRRTPQWSLETFVSPQARAYLPRFLVMGGLLVILLALTPLYRTMRPSTAQSLAALLIAIAGVPTAILMFSENLSARLRVFVSKHFLPFRFDYREEWLRLTETLSLPEQQLPLPERSIKAVAEIVGAPAGLLWMQAGDANPHQCIASWNTRISPQVEVARQDPALAFMRDRQWIIDTAELDRDPEMYDGLRRPAWLDELPDALLLVPLVINEALLGFIVLFQSSSAFRLTFEEIDLLRISGRQVAAHLAQYQADKKLAEAKQFEAFNKLTAFVMHDLKNLIAQQSLLVKNAVTHKGNPEFFEDSMATIENSVARMSKLLRQLQGGETPGQTQRVNLGDALADAIQRTEDRKPAPGLENDTDEMFASLDRERFVAVITHLIRNSQEATTADGFVTVRLQTSSDHAIIVVQDDGCGMPAEFVRNRLFRPFDSTKGSQGMGIGAYQARTFVVDSGGTLDVESEPGRGTLVSIRLPTVT